MYKFLYNFYSAILLVVSTIAFSQDIPNSFYSSLVNQVSESGINSNLETFAAFGIKEVGTTANLNTLNWLIDFYENLGYTDIETQQFSTSGGTATNLIITKTGSIYPDEFIIIDAHYDTVGGVGANDNGTGTVTLLEIAKIIKNIDTEYSIKFIHFSAEEIGLVGSWAYVNNIVIPNNLNIRLVYNIDEVGGVNGMINDTIVCERDESQPNHNNSASYGFTNLLSQCIQAYSNLNTEFGSAYGSDYVPFQENGYVITGLFESNYSPYAHSLQDTMANLDLDYLHEVVKGALGAFLHFVVAKEELSTNENTVNETLIYPNPVSNILHVDKSVSVSEWTILDLSGKVVLKGTYISSGINVSQLDKGTYIINLDSEGAAKSYQFIKK